MASEGVPSWAKGVAYIIAALAALVVAVATTGILGGDTTVREKEVRVELPPPAPTTVAVDGSDQNAEPDKVIELDQEARQTYKRAALAPESLDLAGDLRGADSTPVAQHEGPLATPNFPGCETRILPTNWSNRVVAMSEVDGIGLHYTAGGNLAGKSDMNGLTAYASSASAGVSWHFLIDAEGHCYYSVPLQKKAWTIGNANSETVNIEVIGRGNEPSYPAAPAGARKLRQVVRRLGRVLGIPMRLAGLSNCHVVGSGILTHWQGGACAGGHIDIKPYDIAAVVRQIAANPCGPKCKQRAVVRSRLRKHAALHGRYDLVRPRCRQPMHEHRLRTYTRDRCRVLKRKGHSQHKGVSRARRKLRSL